MLLKNAIDAPTRRIAGRAATSFVVTAAILVLAFTLSADRPADSSPPQAREASPESGTFGEFDAGINNSGTGATVTVDASRAYEGQYSAHAATPSGTRNKFARGLSKVDWRPGQTVWYGSAFYLPSDFYSRVQSDVDILRWDNYDLAQRSQDQSGVTIHHDGRLALLFKNLPTGEYTELTPSSAPLTVGAWHWVEVQQRLGADGAALNELWVDGVRVGSSTTHNTLGRAVTMLRVGLVAEDAAAQSKPLDLWFDRATISASRVGPA